MTSGIKKGQRRTPYAPQHCNRRLDGSSCREGGQEQGSCCDARSYARSHAHSCARLLPPPSIHLMIVPGPPLKCGVGALHVGSTPRLPTKVAPVWEQTGLSLDFQQSSTVAAQPVQELPSDGTLQYSAAMSSGVGRGALANSSEKNRMLALEQEHANQRRVACGHAACPAPPTCRVKKQPLTVGVRLHVMPGAVQEGQGATHQQQGRSGRSAQPRTLQALSPRLPLKEPARQHASTQHASTPARCHARSQSCGRSRGPNN